MYNKDECIFLILKRVINNICIAIFDNIDNIITKCDVLTPVPKFADKFEFSANHAMIIASQLQQNPLEISQKIIEGIKNHKIYQEIFNIEAISGFINIKMKPKFWQNYLNNIIINKDYGFQNYGNNEEINVEYVSANPTGPMHIGHARGAIYGDVICNLLEKCGYKVIREYYINDAGSQIAKVLDSVVFRAKQIIADDFSEKLPENCYPGEYVIETAKAVLEKFGNDIITKPNVNEIIRQFVLSYMLDEIKKDLHKLGVHHSTFTSEFEITKLGKVDEAIVLLEQKGLIYKGILEQPKGEKMEDWEPIDQLLFASSKFGDDSDRPIQKSDGSWAYFAPDIAYHYHKYIGGQSFAKNGEIIHRNGVKKMILVLGADHKGYKKRISAAVNAMSDGIANVDVILCELVNFVKNGEPVKMSKRAGNFLSLSDVLDEIDPQILRFFLITKKNDTVVDFDFEKVIEQSKDNPIFYIQYAHSRCCSLLNKAKENDIIIPTEECDKFLDFISHETQIAIIHKLAQYPKLIKHCVENLCPHLITHYLYELAKMFHSLWSVPDFRFISDNKNQTIANLILVQTIQKIIQSSLNCIGVEPMEKM